jgi:predicted anti-sigma-YlaC factor YlaD
LARAPQAGIVRDRRVAAVISTKIQREKRRPCADGRRAAVLLAALALGGCSARHFAAARVAEVLAAGGSGWGADDDPQLVGEALPFALKTYESLLAELPDHPGLLLATCRGFVSYAAGWVEAEADAVEADSYASAAAARTRARKLHLRGRDYCLRALERRWPGLPERLSIDPAQALAAATHFDAELLYWTGAAWGSAIALGADRPELVGDLPIVRALFERVIALDEGFDRGAAHEAMIALDARPAAMGGSEDRARRHYDRAVALSGGLRASPHVAWARSWALARQDRTEFRAALERALAVDTNASPSDRLANALAQQRARLLLSRIDDLLLDDSGSTE